MAVIHVRPDGIPLTDSEFEEIVTATWVVLNDAPDSMYAAFRKLAADDAFHRRQYAMRNHTHQWLLVPQIDGVHPAFAWCPECDGRKDYE